jgi:transposase-like protein
VHQTANVLAKLPKSQQPKAKRALQEIWMAETKVAAELAFNAFIESYAVKYEKATDFLKGSRRAACFLRLPSRALETFTDHQPH